MEKELTAEEVAILIRSRKIINAKGLPRDVDVTQICAHAGISRKTGYQWAEQLNAVDGEHEALQQGHEELKKELEDLKKRFDDVRFENEGRKLAWKLHDVDQLLAEKKKHFKTPEKGEAVTFLRHEGRPLREIGWLLNLKASTLSEWNGLFDEKMHPVAMPDMRGKTVKVTPQLVRQVVAAAQDFTKEGKRLRIKSFTRLLTAQQIILSAKTVTEILIANDLYATQVKKRRPRFYQNIRQTIPNGLVGVDGKEFIVVVGDDTHRLNLELCVDVKSFCHSGVSVAETETTEEFIKVMEAHRAAWGSPLAVVMDHGSANLSTEAKAYLKEHDIEPVPAGPANPKGNGSAEGAFSEMQEVIGPIRLNTSSPRELAKSVLEKVAAVYITMRNRLPRIGTDRPPLEEMKDTSSEQERAHLKEGYQARARQKAKNPDHTTKHERLNWLIDHYHLDVDGPSLARAKKCIAHYEFEAISRSEEAFHRAINRDAGRRTFPYFFGILKNIQQEMDTARYQEYCQQRYNYQQMLDQERRRHEEQEGNQTTTETFVELIREAMATPIDFIRETALNQAKRMALNLKKQYRYLGALKNKVWETLSGIKEISTEQRQEIIKLVEQFAT